MMNTKRSVSEGILKTLYPMLDMSKKHLTEISSKTYVETFPADFMLFKQGAYDPWNVYLLSGEIEYYCDNNVIEVIQSNDKKAKHPINKETPHPYSAKSKTSVHIIRIDASYLDLLLTWQEFPDELFSSQTQVDPDDDNGWLKIALKGNIFNNIDKTKTQKLIKRLRDIKVKKEDIIVEEGDSKDDFYIIKAGTCKVTKRIDGQIQEISELKLGDCFGEEAIISGEKRSATITMLSDGVLAKLTKYNFNAIVSQIGDNEYLYIVAKAEVDQGKAVWLDIRSAEEYRLTNIPGSLNIPLFELRDRILSLDMGRKYIICCDNGKRSKTASFILTQRGFSNYILANGINVIPQNSLQQSNLLAEPLDSLTTFTRKEPEVKSVKGEQSKVEKEAIINEATSFSEEAISSDEISDPIKPINSIEDSSTEINSFSNKFEEAIVEINTTKEKLQEVKTQLDEANTIKNNMAISHAEIEEKIKQQIYLDNENQKELMEQLKESNRELQKALKLKIAAENSRLQVEKEIAELKQKQNQFDDNELITPEQTEVFAGQVNDLAQMGKVHVAVEEIINEEIDDIANAKTVILKGVSKKPKKHPNKKKSLLPDLKQLSLVQIRAGIGIMIVIMIMPLVFIITKKQSSLPIPATKTVQESVKPQRKDKVPQHYTLTLNNSQHQTLFKIGDTMTATIKTNQDAYLHCYYRNGDRKIMKIFPNTYAPNALLKANKTLILPNTKMLFEIKFDKSGYEMIMCIATSSKDLSSLAEEYKMIDFSTLKTNEFDDISVAFSHADLKILGMAQMSVIISE